MGTLARLQGDPSEFSRVVFGTPLHGGQKRYACNATADVNFLLPGNSWGKALRNGTPVLRPDGSWTAIENLSVGDAVVGGDGKPVEVVGVFPQGERPTWRLTFRDGAVDCDEDHLWYDSRREAVVRTGDVVKHTSRKAALCVPTVATEQPHREVPVDPYAIGALLGDGSLRGSMAKFTTADPEMLTFLPWEATSYGGYDYGLKGCKKDVTPLGIYGHTAHTKFIPELYKSNSIEVRLAVLRGLMDTDGWVHGTQVGYCSASEQLASDVAYLVRSLGGFVSMRKKDDAFVLNITLRECPFRLSRKAEAWKKQHATRARTYDRILQRSEFIGNHEATCIKVANPDGLFVTKDYIVTHNTEFIARFVTYLAWYKISLNPPTSAQEWLKHRWRGLVASYNYSIAKESFSRLKEYRQHNPNLAALITSIRDGEVTEITFSNGSVVTWGSLDGEGKLVEATRRQVILVDEAGHIPDLSYTFDSILFPRTMGVGGQIHLLGTPKPHSDPYLLEVYEKGRDGKDPFYYSQDGSVLENEFWPASERRRVLANPRYVSGWEDCEYGVLCQAPICEDGKHPILTSIGGQVLLGRFVLAGGYFFNRFATARMFSGEHEVKWHGEQSFRAEPRKGRLYLGAFDIAGNKRRRKKRQGSDATVGMVLDYTERPWKVVAYEYVEGGDADWQDKYALMQNFYEQYPMPYLVIDATGSVDSVQEELERRGIAVQGLTFGGLGSKKYDMLRNLQLCLDLEYDGNKGIIRCPLIPRLKHELDHYILPDDDIEQDCVMTLSMLAQEVSQWELPAAVYGDVY